MSASDRKARSILLHKRYELISSGVDRHSIRLPNNSLLVGGRKYGSIVNQSFGLCPSERHTSPANSPGHIPQHATNSTGVSPAAGDDTSLRSTSSANDLTSNPLSDPSPPAPFLFTPLALPCGLWTLGAYTIN